MLYHFVWNYIYARQHVSENTGKTAGTKPLEQTNKKVGCQALITTWHHVKSVWTWDIPEYAYIYINIYIYILYIYIYIYIYYTHIIYICKFQWRNHEQPLDFGGTLFPEGTLDLGSFSAQGEFLEFDWNPQIAVTHTCTYIQSIQ